MIRALSLAAALLLVLLLTTAASSCDTTTTPGGGDSKGEGATTVEFTVTGEAPDGADVTYGNDSSNYDWPPRSSTQTLPVEKGALYYQITVQLGGSGEVTCKVQIGDAVKVGHARGGYNICTAQLNSDPINGGWG